MKNINLIELTAEELIDLINKGIRSQLEELKLDLGTQTNRKELLSRDETCELLDINRTTLWRWSCQGKVQSYGISGRRYYKRTEILASLKSNNLDDHKKK